MVFAEESLYLFGGFSKQGYFNDLYSFDLRSYRWQLVSETVNGATPSQR